MDLDSRSQIYGLLALLFSKEVSGKLLDILLKYTKTGFWGESEIDLFSEFEGETKENIQDCLASEFARIFIGPDKHLAPNESLYHERGDGQFGSLWGKDTAEVKRFVESVGFKYNDDFSGLPDHISAEFELMQKLLRDHALMVQKNGLGPSEKIESLEVWFLKNHLLTWVPEYCQKVSEVAELNFYKELANTTIDFLQNESELMGIELAV